MATIVNAQSSIEAAEKKTRKTANEVYHAVRSIGDQMRKLETEKSALSSRLRQLEAEGKYMNASVRSAERDTVRRQDQLEEMMERSTNTMKESRGPSMGELWLDKG